MKKWTTALLALGLSSSASAHTGPFSGIYGGLSVGLIQNEVYGDFMSHVSIPIDDFNLFLNTSPDQITDNSVMGGLSLGYAALFNQLFILGIEGRANFQDLDVSITDTHHEFRSGFFSTETTYIDLDTDFAILAKLGVVVDPRILIYGLAGIDWGKLKLQSDAVVTNSSVQAMSSTQLHSSHYKAGYVLGIGTEFLTTKCTSFAFEYNFTQYNDLDVTSPVATPITTNGEPIPDAFFTTFYENIKVKTNKLTLRFNYYYH